MYCVVYMDKVVVEQFKLEKSSCTAISEGSTQIIQTKSLAIEKCLRQKKQRLKYALEDLKYIEAVKVG